MSGVYEVLFVLVLFSGWECSGFFCLFWGGGQEFFVGVSFWWCRFFVWGFVVCFFSPSPLLVSETELARV